MATEEKLRLGLTQACKQISMPHSALMISIALFLLGYFPQSNAQMSGSIDCSGPTKQPYRFGPLTRDEKIGVVGKQFSTEVSRVEKCATQNKDNSATDSGNVGTANNSDPNQKHKLLENSPNQKSSPTRESSRSSNSSRPEEQDSISANAIKNGGKSVAFSTDGSQISNTSFSDDFDSSSETNLAAPPDLNGKQHEQLESTDNLQILKEQIKAQAEIETDPAVKKELLKKYEEL